MTDPPDVTSAQHSQLVEQIVLFMRQQRGDQPCAAVIDRRLLRTLAVGEGPADSHIAWDEACRDRERYAPIPSRDRIETMEHIGAFIEDEYALDETETYRQAFDALMEAGTTADWRHLLGHDHDAVHAFDAYIRDFHVVVARMLMHGSQRLRVGVLGTDRITRLTGDGS